MTQVSGGSDAAVTHSPVAAHRDHESSIYVVRGVLHMEYGAGGGSSFDAVAGDVVHVPA